MSGSGQPIGWAQYEDWGTEYNSVIFVLRRVLARVRTAALVQVKAVNPMGVAGFAMPVGTVNVQPLVKMVDGQNHPSSHGIINQLPYLRIQGGSNAIIMDPQVGDIGVALFCDRDISSVKNTLAEAPPGSWRQFNMADGLYFGGGLNGTPNQYIYMLPGGGIHIVDKYGNAIQMSASGTVITDANNNLINMESAGISVNGTVIPMSGSGTGQSGTFTSADSKTITVKNGIIIGIV